MVAGGYGSGHFLASAELLRPGASSWTTAAALPYAAEGLRSASLAGRLYVSGGHYQPGSGYNSRGECG